MKFITKNKIITKEVFMLGWLLPFVVVVDPLINQFAVIQGYDEQGSPLLQVFRLIILGMVFLRLFLNPIQLTRVRIFRILMYFLLSILLSSIFNGVNIDDIKNYGHIIYWGLLWIFAEIICKQSKLRRRLENGLIIGSIIIICSVILGYIINNSFNYNGVEGLSAGWFNSAKTTPVTGSLGLFLFAYRNENKHPYWTSIIFLITLFTVWLMQGRASILAFASATIWVFYRQVKKSKIIKGWGGKIIIFLFIAILFILYGNEFGLFNLNKYSLFTVNRWSELTSEHAGSGRKIFWVIDLNKYLSLDFLGKLFGIGLSGIKLVNLNRYGIAIHAHNDLLDAILAGGIFMLFTFLTIWRFLIKNSLTSKINYSRQTFAMALVIMLIVNGVLTGFLFSASDMFAILAAWSCITFFDEFKRVQPGFPR